MAFVNCAYIYGEGEEVVLSVTEYESDGKPRTALRLGGEITLQMDRAQLTELANSLCDYLALSQEEVACTGEAGLTAAAPQQCQKWITPGGARNNGYPCGADADPASPHGFCERHAEEAAAA